MEQPGYITEADIRISIPETSAVTQEEGFPASGWMTAGNSMCKRRNQAVKTGGSGKISREEEPGLYSGSVAQP